MQTSLREDSDPWNKLDAEDQKKLRQQATEVNNKFFRERQNKSQQQALALAQQQQQPDPPREPSFLDALGSGLKNCLFADCRDFEAREQREEEERKRHYDRVNKKYEEDWQEIYHERVLFHTQRLREIYEDAEREWLAAKANFDSEKQKKDGSYMSIVTENNAKINLKEAHNKMLKAMAASLDKNTIDDLAQEDANRRVKPPNYAYSRGGGNNTKKTKKTKRRHRKKTARHRKKTARHRKKSLRHRKKSVRHRNNH